MVRLAILDPEVQTAEQLEQEILKFRTSQKGSTLAPNFISFKEGKRRVTVSIDEVLYLEADHVYIKVVSTDKVRLVRKSLVDILDELPSSGFLRVHRSFIVNLKHVEEVTAGYLTVKEQRIPVGRTFRGQVREIFPI